MKYTTDALLLLYRYCDSRKYSYSPNTGCSCRLIDLHSYFLLYIYIYIYINNTFHVRVFCTFVPSNTSSYYLITALKKKRQIEMVALAQSPWFGGYSKTLQKHNCPRIDWMLVTILFLLSLQKLILLLVLAYARARANSKMDNGSNIFR